jgi:trimethylamine--corrinoid protein Co-methyltransferase
MMTPGNIHSQGVRLKILSDPQLEEIIQSAYTIIESTGFRILKKSACQLLENAGATVTDDLVYVPRAIVQHCFNTAPKGIQVYNRLGEPSMKLWGNHVYYGTSTASPRTRNALTGDIHPTQVEDISIGAKLADALPNIDFVMPFGSSQDVDPNVADLYEFETVVQNTVKPVIFCGYTPMGVETVFEMAATVAGGKERLKKKPFIISYPEPISPMTYPEAIIDKMYVSADWGIPQITCGAGQLGGTSPVTLSGSLVQMLAEAMMTVTLVQLYKPGAPMFLAANFGMFDMQSGLCGMASPEGCLLHGALAEIGRYFGLPSWGYAGTTNSKVLDAQAGIESALTMMAQGLAGVNVIHDVGYMDMGMICSADMLVMGNEVAGFIKRFVGGISTEPDQLALSVIQKVGAGGNYLQEKHTFQHFKSCWYPELFARGSYAGWEAAGKKNLADKCSEKVRQILETHTPIPLAQPIKETVAQIRKTGEKRIMKQMALNA